MPNQGAVVRGPTVRDVREGYEVRAELEGMAAALAATWITDEHLSELREAEELFRRAIEDSPAGPSTARTGTRGCAPTTSSTRRSRPPPATSACGARSATSTRRSRAASPGARSQADSRLMAENVEQHSEILAAIERRDPDGARDAMRRHVLRAGELIARWVEQR